VSSPEQSAPRSGSIIGVESQGVRSSDRGRRGAAAFARQAGFVAPSVGFAGVFALSAAELYGLLGTAYARVAVLLAVLPGLAAADLASGVVHWLCDRFGDERTPLVGRVVIAPFREHHVDPDYLARKDFFDASASNAWLALALQGTWLWLSHPATGADEIFAASFMLSLSTGVFLTNTFHQWAHQQAPPRVARLLRRLRLAITPEHHARHHRSGDRAYCVTTGWCNAALERWRVFERLERWTAPLRSVGRSRSPSDA
jgi:ubiquitin-conjugating enzyme E2 variant